MPNRLRRHLSYANVMATSALFIALGGGAYAATTLPAASVGTKQIKKNAVVSSRVKDRSLLARDFKAGQLPAGPRGMKGDTGPQGPGAVSVNGQFDRDGTFHNIAAFGGVNVYVECDSATNGVNIDLAPFTPNGLYGWGTSTDASGVHPQNITSGGAIGSVPGSLQLDVVVTPTHLGLAERYVRFDISAISGSKCNYHGVAIPSS